MPLIMQDHKLTPEQEEGHARLMNYLYPEYSHQSWADKLKSNGLGLDQFATMYAESLHSVSPAMKLKAIERMLTILGVDARVDAIKEATNNQPTIVVQLQSGSTANLLSMVAPQRQLTSPVIESVFEHSSENVDADEEDDEPEIDNDD